MNLIEILKQYFLCNKKNAKIVFLTNRGSISWM